MMIPFTLHKSTVFKRNDHFAKGFFINPRYENGFLMKSSFCEGFSIYPLEYEFERNGNRRAGGKRALNKMLNWGRRVLNDMVDKYPNGECEHNNMLNCGRGVRNEKVA